MRPKRFIITVSACLAIAVLFLYAIPLQTSFQADVTVNADNFITCRTLSDTTTWNKWYFNDKTLSPAFNKFEKGANWKYQLFDYNLNENGSLRNGQVQVLKNSKWNTQITWVEQLVVKRNISQKLKIIFEPSVLKAQFLQNIAQFKSQIEHPDNTFAGLTFERTEIPSNKIVVAYDTVAFNNIEDHISALYKKIVTGLPSEKITNPGAFLSQYEKIGDSTIQLCVGVEVADDVNTVKAPFELLDVDGYPAIIIHTLRNYTDMNDDVAVMYEWLKKNDARPSTSYWVKHDLNKDVVTGIDKNKLTIIQGIYLLNEKAAK